MRRNRLYLALVLTLLAAGCASSRSHTRGVTIERGVASWYGPGFHGLRTASGERYDMEAMTAAHRTLPFGTVVEVRNLENGRTTRVKINDRGPFMKNRILDLSRAAAEALGIVGPGTALVEIAAVGVEPLGGFDYIVQVGAFRDHEAATELLGRLRSDYPSATIRSDDVWSRVQIDSFPSRAEAQRLVAELARRGIAAVVIASARLETSAGRPAS